MSRPSATQSPVGDDLPAACATSAARTAGSAATLRRRLGRSGGADLVGDVAAVEQDLLAELDRDALGDLAGGRRPTSRAARPTQRYIAPVSRYVKPSRSATARATVDFPAPAGPSMAMTMAEDHSLVGYERDSHDLWHPETVYLNTASFGLPPDPVWDAVQAAQADWRAGRVSWEHWTAVTGRARAEFATLVRRRPRAASRSGATVSGLIAQIAAAIPDGSRVLAPEPEFTSLLFPFLAQAERGVTVEVVPLDRLAEAIDATHRRRRGVGGAVLDRRARGARRHRGRGAPPRRADGGRRDARDRLAAARRVALRRGRVRRVTSG